MNSSSSSPKPDISLSLSLPQSPTTNDHQSLEPQERGVKLIQLLLTCANHASSGNLHHADACLRRISQLASVSGDSMQRLAARFASALAARLVKRWPGLYKALNNSGPFSNYDTDLARTIFARALPCLSFAYAIIKRTLLQTLSGENMIHVIDLGSCDPKLWVPFIRGIEIGSDGPGHLKITCVSRDKEAQLRLGSRLVKEAESLNIPFQFNPVNADIREVTPAMLGLQSGEAVGLASILSLHTLLAEDDRVFGMAKNADTKECKAMNRFLETVRSLEPKAVLLVEQEANHNSSRLADRFVEGLHYYSAVFDSVDAAFGGLPCSDRTVLEEMYGREIEDIVAGDGLEREERHERYVNWAARFSRAGFRPVTLWYNLMEEAQHVVEAYGLRGFKIVGQKGSLIICWHDRPIYAVSAWNCFSLNSDI